MMFYQQSYKSPIGTLLLRANEQALVSVEFYSGGSTNRDDENAHPLLEACIRQLADYFCGTRTSFDLPMAQSGTSFQRKVWEMLAEIPYGTTTSYACLAKTFGDLKAIRAIAAANGRNKLALIVPCHRIIGSNGDLTGYAWGLERKRWLLEHEARFSGNERQLQLF